MVNPQGMIIAFEGLDYSFKETNSKAFYERLKATLENERPTESSDYLVYQTFPRYTNDSSLFVRGWLNGSYNREALKECPTLVNSFYALDRMDFWYSIGSRGTNTSNINSIRDKCFIFDRYSFSNTIYNGGNTLIRINDISYEEKNFLVPLPDIVVFLRYPTLQLFLDNLKSKNGKDENERDIDFLTTAYNRLDRLIDLLIDPDVYSTFSKPIIPVIVDVTNSHSAIRDRDNIADEVWYRTVSAMYKVVNNRKYG